VLWSRLAAEAGDRPKLLDHDRTRALYDARAGDYRRADVAVEVAADEPPQAIADRICAALPEVACGT
jgi:hypothetical protein